MISILLFLISLILLYVYCIFPRLSKKKQVDLFKKYLYAHRGLHNHEFPENSLPALERAKNHGFGIELDVHLTLDEKLVICHDYNIKRACGIEAEISKCTYEQLKKYTLFNTDFHLPELKEILGFIDHQVPLIIEIKQQGMNFRICEVLSKQLDKYKTDFVVESFNPMMMNWFSKHRPNIIRGQLSCDYQDNHKISKPFKFLIKHLCLNFLSRPDFIAYDIKARNEFSFRLLNHFTPSVLWTCKNQTSFDLVKKQL